jgi:MFS family permease
MKDKAKRGGFYGWIALSGAVFALFVSGGAYSHSFGVFLPVVTSEFGWSRAAFAAALSLGLLAMGLPSSLWGITTARFGSRANIIVGSILSGVGFAALYFLNQLWYLYLIFIIVGFGIGIGGYIPCTTITNNWFTKNFSLAMGITSTAGGLSAFVFPPLTAVLIASVDWRLTWVILGGIILIGSTIISGILLVRNRPEEIGQVPDGVNTEPSEAYKTHVPSKIESDQAELPLKNLIKMRITWLIIIFGTANAWVIGTIFTHQVAYVRDLGFSPMTAATTMSILAVSNILSSLTFGALALRFNLRYLAASAFLIQLTAMVILLTSHELAWLYLYSTLIGMGVGALGTAMPTFIGSYYGRRLYARVMGFAYAFFVLAMAASGTIAGAIYDSNGTYTLAFIVVIVFIFIGLVSLFFARSSRAVLASTRYL